MSGGILAFEGFNLKGILKKIKDNPERIFLGAADPFSSKMWGKVTGKNYEPMVDQMGGATQQSYKDAEAAGIDTTAGKGMHSIAHVIAAAYAGGYGAGSLGGAGGAGAGTAGGLGAEGAAAVGGSSAAGGAAGGGAAIGGGAGAAGGAVTATLPTVVVSGSSAGAAGGGLSGLGGLAAAGGAAGAAAGMSSSDKAALYGNEGYGEGMTGAETSAYDKALKGGSKTINFPSMNGSQEEERLEPIRPLEVTFDAEGNPMITSTKSAKTPVVGMQDALMQRGASGNNYIDQVGMHIAAIQALSSFFDEIEQALQEAVKKKGA